MEVKVSASFSIPGGKLYSEQYCKDNNLHTNYTMKIFGKKVVTLNWKERVSKLATQRINLSVEAYYHMTDSQACPTWHRNREWLQMSRRKRLESHLNMIAEDLHGVLNEYEIFE